MREKVYHRHGNKFDTMSIKFLQCVNSQNACFCGGRSSWNWERAFILLGEACIFILRAGEYNNIAQKFRLWWAILYSVHVFFCRHACVAWKFWMAAPTNCFHFVQACLQRYYCVPSWLYGDFHFFLQCLKHCVASKQKLHGKNLNGGKEFRGGHTMVAWKMCKGGMHKSLTFV